LQIEAAQPHFCQAQMNIVWPIYAVSIHNFAPKVAGVIGTRDFTLQICLKHSSALDFRKFAVCGMGTLKAAVGGTVYRTARYEGLRCGTALPVPLRVVPHRKLRYDDLNCGTTSKLIKFDQKSPILFLENKNGE
jgi:hypothetical protein